MIGGLYRGLTIVGGPAIRWWLDRRRRAGKEDGDRFPERLGHPMRPRPEGRLVWIHGASVGECLGALPLIADLRARRPAVAILVTSGTVTAARMLAERLPQGAVHAYVPVDRPAWVARFLDHWRPDLALWMESELWPNLIAETARRGVPMALVNARLSARSHGNWRRVGGWARRIVGAFDLVLTPDAIQAERFRSLGGRDVRVAGNLKASATLPDADPAVLDALRRAIGARPRWLAASTHPGEDPVAMDAQRRLLADRPDLLLILVPRHADRGPAIAAAANAAGFRVTRRGAGETVAAETQIHIGDTMGEMGLYYRLADLVFLGGSLDVDRGGHNPIEPALAGAAIVHGPDMANFAGIAARLADAGATETVRDAPALAEAVGRLADDVPERRRRAEAARTIALSEAGALDAVRDALAPLLDRMGRARA